ncbi:MAG: LEA type 2 family protein [Bacteroidia bacterium]|nr:LEA type 2 family protein [Bacteroidia bacterium]
MIFRLFFILFFLIHLFSCKPLEEIKVKGVEKFYINKINTDKIDAELQLNIYNPNKNGFTIYPSSFDITFSGIRLGTAKLNEKVKINSQSDQVYTFVLSSKLSQINPLDVLQLINFKNAGKIELKGNLKVGKFLIKKSIPINYSEKVNLWPKL